MKKNLNFDFKITMNLSLNSSGPIDYSELFLDYVRKINISSVFLITILGLTGHLLTLAVYSQKKNRLNSSNIYIMCLTMSDFSFLTLNFFGNQLLNIINYYCFFCNFKIKFIEDIVRTLEDIYLVENKMLNVMNIVDAYEWACVSVNYLRNSIRFISTYISEIDCLEKYVCISII